MVGHFTGIFAGHEKKAGKNGDYYILRFLDENGKLFECIAKDDLDTIVCLDRLQEVDFIAEVDIGRTYTKITFKGLV